MTEQSIKIPKERIPILIGKNGQTKKELEKILSAKIDVDSETGEINVKTKKAGIESLRAIDIITAIGRGFSPEKAKILLDYDYFLEVLDLTEYVGKAKKGLITKKGRIIGTGGKIRENIEETTDGFVSVYGKTVSIICKEEKMWIAKKSIEMLINGASIPNVKQFLEKSVRENRFEQIGL